MPVYQSDVDISVRVLYGFITTKSISEKAYAEYVTKYNLSIGMQFIWCGDMYKTVVYTNKADELYTRNNNGIVFSLDGIYKTKPDESQLRQFANHFEIGFPDIDWLVIAEKKL